MKIVKLFLQLALPIMAASFLFIWILFSVIFDLITAGQAVWIAGIVAGAITLSITIAQIATAAQSFAKNFSEKMSLKQSRIIRFRGNADLKMRGLKDRLVQNKWHLFEENSDHLYYKFYTGNHGHSEEVTIICNKESNEVKVVSEPSWFWSIIDFGRNQRNIRKVSQYLAQA